MKLGCSLNLHLPESGLSVAHLGMHPGRAWEVNSRPGKRIDLTRTKDARSLELREKKRRTECHLASTKNDQNQTAKRPLVSQDQKKRERHGKNG